MKTALITGITGQDGSYLAEFLLEQGYRVVGMQRRTSTETVGRIAHLLDKIDLVQGDLLDMLSLIDLMKEYQPDEVYNLAAQSFVPTSWQQPVLTGEFTGLGVTRVLEAIRLVKPDARFYQASSSEMFGKVQEVPQRETTPFYPRSPYGVSKVYGHWITVNYRESYDLFACSGILFNHECLSDTTPLIVRQDGQIQIVTPDELVPLMRKGTSVQTFEVPGLQVWDGCSWTDVRGITATRRRKANPDHQLLLIQARGGVAEVTPHHHMIDAEGGVIPAREVDLASHLAIAPEFPDATGWTSLTPELAEFLGLMTAEGYISAEGRAQFTNNDASLSSRVSELWSRLFLGTTSQRCSISGWNSDEKTGQLYLNGDRLAGRWLREQLYSHAGLKRVPPLVLNSTANIQAAYLKGYYAGDGLKAGNGESVKTNSPLLAQGLCWLYAVQGRDASVYVEQRGESTYYQLNIFSGDIPGNKGRHLRKPASEVRKITEVVTPGDWVFDLETDSGRLLAGVGRLVVHNSPRRGIEFVTRKVSHGVARIKLGLDRELRLGNLDAQRDWGYAGDYVQAMWRMLQQDNPDDFVVSTGRTHSVERLCQLAFDAVDLNWQDYVEVDPRFIRPAEVDLLVGDSSKARAVLGWEPHVSFEQLVERMVEADLRLLRGDAPPPGTVDVDR